MKEYALLGRCLGHSFSAEIHNNRFLREGVDARYILLERATLGDLREFLTVNPQIKGFNVTIPYKEEIIQLLDIISPLARETGAVNIVRVDRTSTGRIILSGFNTDVFGFRESIRPLLPSGASRAIILGNGGAAKAVITALSQLSISPLIVTRRRAHALTKFPGYDVIDYRMLDVATVADIPIVINATPVGMYPDQESAPDIPYKAMDEGHLCYDLIYNPKTTLFMKWSARYGAAVSNGLRMLQLQADEAWKIWRQRINPLLS